MTRREEERINAEAHEDLVMLVKEYARRGYKDTHGRGDNKFEELWGRAFDADSTDEEAPLG